MFGDWKTVYWIRVKAVNREREMSKRTLEGVPRIHRHVLVVEIKLNYESTLSKLMGSM